MRVVTAPEKIDEKVNGCEVRVFLAGGITDCKDWQKSVINVLKDYDRSHPGELDDLVVYNPRRENFPIGDPNAGKEQIEWEFDALLDMHIFSIYFAESDSDQPICMYELGRYLLQMTDIYPSDLENHVVITSDPKYKRHLDVLEQTRLATSGKYRVKETSSVISHAFDILFAYKKLTELDKCEDPRMAEPDKY